MLCSILLVDFVQFYPFPSGLLHWHLGNHKKILPEFTGPTESDMLNPDKHKETSACFMWYTIKDHRYLAINVELWAV